MNINNIPNIQQAPRTASDTAIHYGYVAFRDINLAGSLGVEIQAQPDHSPYRRILPCRELIPFTNIEYGAQDDVAAAKGSYSDKKPPAVVRVSKSARNCAEDIELAYQRWNFVVLRPLTGFSEADAFQVFQTIQPFHYKLRDIEYQLNEAKYRIEATEPYETTYGDVSLELPPLRDELKDVARKVLALIKASASRAVTLATETRDHTTIQMTAAFAGQGGRMLADPLDKFVSEELGWEIPKLLHSEKEGKPTVYGESPESLELKRKEIELQERQLAIQERQIALLEKQENRDKMAHARAAKGKEAAEAA